MVLNHSCREQFPLDRPQKLKHLMPSNVYYKLLNTSYIFIIIVGNIVDVTNFKAVDRNQ